MKLGWRLVDCLYGGHFLPLSMMGKLFVKSLGAYLGGRMTEKDALWWYIGNSWWLVALGLFACLLALRYAWEGYWQNDFDGGFCLDVWCAWDAFVIVAFLPISIKVIVFGLHWHCLEATWTLWWWNGLLWFICLGWFFRHLTRIRSAERGWPLPVSPLNGNRNQNMHSTNEVCSIFPVWH